MGGAWIWVVGGMRREGRKQASERAIGRYQQRDESASATSVLGGHGDRLCLLLLFLLFLLVLQTQKGVSGCVQSGCVQSAGMCRLRVPRGPC
jgi:hypothetical protein